jgi:murein DD-endopeptidase MepM/ murein hydrolase activator NlpD
MELIVLSGRRRVQRALHLGGLLVGLLGLVVVALLGGAFWLGVHVSHVSDPVASADPRPDLYAAVMREELAQYESRVEGAVGDARRDLDALALRLSDLQARAIRLDALGGRLVELAGLDAAEFSFGEAPPRGGPAPTGTEDPNTVPDFIASLSNLDEVLELRGQELAALEGSLMSGRLAAAATPAGPPVLSGWISSTFGRRSDPLTGARSMHMGVDFAGKRGSAIRSVAAGIVAFAGTRSGLGRVVEIDHGKGYVTRYAHNMENLVKPGQRVAKGQQIAKMGSSGRSTGNHVHFEVLRDGEPLDPMSYIRAARKGS